MQLLVGVCRKRTYSLHNRRRRAFEFERSGEQRQAREAWLRRVPDDPGGLLRAKFRLEYERRQREGQ